MRYRNLKTGAIINSPCAISGGDWVAEETTIAIEVEEKQVEIKEKIEKVEKVEKVEVSEESIDEITVKEIKQELDALGIEYSSRANKKELYNLMMQGR